MAKHLFKKQNYTGGFTIIETLVAVTVLMIAVAGPLVVASKGLTTALYSRDQTIASFLAQETMEVIKNTRDNNIASLTPANWLKGFESCLSNSTLCDMGAADSTVKIGCSSSGCPIYFDRASSLYNNVSGETTLFKRYFFLTAPVTAYPSTPGLCIQSDSECKANVVVTWNEGNVQNEIYLSSELVNVVRQ